MQPRWRRPAFLSSLNVAATALATACALVVWAQAPWRQVPALVEQGGARLLVTLLPWPLALGCDAWAWGVLLEALGIPPGPWWRRWLIRLVSEAVLLSLPGGSVLAEILKIGLYCHVSGAPVAAVAASVAVKKVLVIGAEAPYLWTAAAWGVSHGVPLIIALVPAAAAVVAVAVAVLGARFVSRPSAGRRWAEVAEQLGRRGGAWAVVARPLSDLIGTEQGARKLLRRTAPSSADQTSRAKSQRAVALATGALFIAWCLEGVDLAVAAWAARSPVALWQAFFADSCAGFARAVAFVVPGGWGAQDLGLVTVLEEVGHLSESSAAWIAVIKRAKEVFFVVTGYSLGFAIKAAWRKDRRPRTNPPTLGA